MNRYAGDDSGQRRGGYEQICDREVGLWGTTKHTQMVVKAVYEDGSRDA